ncbi:response regulator transcription factor [Sulfurovum sp. NBC37-1]|uniref:response regulator transcription factor n=1 Tax=Sulfurovum sp. (strain NBC37-1) TaxID=387093 RepID=UPI0001587DBF|nr:response regulator transcription factor [Sulfurovum sp. NBC37-1]BAF73393.1 two-component response regulator [Sulfurovum sp. NBC37-1]
MPKLTILYAEDDQVTRENYALVLEQYFRKVYTTKDGKEALVLYYKEKPDVLLLDINMPYIDGLEMVKTIREEDSETPVMILTAHSDKEKLLKAIPLGLTKYLVKPIKDDIFRKTMHELIARIKTKGLIHLKNSFIWNQGYTELSYQGTLVKLSQKEKLLIGLLTSPVEHFVSQERLIENIWHDEEIDKTHPNKLSQLIYRLHAKLSEKAGRKIVLIENSYALGYRLLI